MIAAQMFPHKRPRNRLETKQQKVKTNGIKRFTLNGQQQSPAETFSSWIFFILFLKSSMVIHLNVLMLLC